MSAETPLDISDALTNVSEVQSDIEVLVFQLESDMRNTLFPLGFTHKPDEWYGSTHQIFTDLNREYRHEAKIDVLEGARKIRRLKGRGFLATHVVSLSRMATKAEGQLQELLQLCTANGDAICVADALFLEEHIPLFQNAVDVVKQRAADAAHAYRQWEPAFKALEVPAHELKALTAVLGNAVSQKTNVLGARPLLLLLADIHQKRLTLGATAAATSTAIQAVFHSEGPLIPRAVYEQEMAPLQAITRALQDQVVLQSSTLQAFTAYSDSAGSSPGMLPSAGNVDISVDLLRRAGLEFKKLLDDVKLGDEVYDIFDLSVRRVLKRLRWQFAAM